MSRRREHHGNGAGTHALQRVEDAVEDMPLGPSGSSDDPPQATDDSYSRGSPQQLSPGMAVWRDRAQSGSFSLAAPSPLSMSNLPPPEQSPSWPNPQLADPRFSSGDSLSALQEPAPAEPILDAGREVLLVFRLASTLLGYLGIGWKWMVALGQLVAFAGLLMPGFLQMVLFYFFSPRIHRSVRYGPHPRNFLDVYVPRLQWLTLEGPRPVVIYVTGGAWTIGYKAWGALVGRRLSQRGVLVFCLDYRNFPQGTGLDMLEDVNAGIAWVLHICQYFGGDPGAVHLVGQSAGAQLVSLALFRQAKRSSRCKGTRGGSAKQQQQQDGLEGDEWEDEEGWEDEAEAEEQEEEPGCRPVWDPCQVQSFVGVSGAYDLQELHVHLHRRGMYMSLLREIFTVDGKVAYRQLSPTHVARSLGARDWALVPPIHLLHGTRDRTVPPEIASEFQRAVTDAGGAADLRMWPGKTHTSPIVEDPLRGKDSMLDAILSVVQGAEVHVKGSPMVPGFLADLASLVSPF